MTNAVKMMMARDDAARAMNEMKAADAAWEAEASEANNARQAAARKAWARAVKKVEALQRKQWKEQDAA